MANEEKINSNDSDKIVYNEIKEKIIQRTIHYKPDFASVVSNVVDEMKRFLYCIPDSIMIDIL